MMRKKKLFRKTKETEIKVSLNIDGRGEFKVKSPILLLNHLLESFSFFGLFDLEIEAKGEDFHHLNEDIGIVLGEAFEKALGDKRGIERFGFSYVPMGQTLARCVIDINGRGGLYINSLSKTELNFEVTDPKSKYSFRDFESFLEAFSKHSKITINVAILQKEDLHHQLEATFKALGLALRQAVKINPLFKKRIPSTKGIID
jgi:imidazoleglycerol-phosphate dehydratase